MAKFSIFRKIDETISTKILEFQESSEHIKFSNAYASWDEKYQELTKLTLLLISTLLPFVICLIFLFSNLSQKDDLMVRENLMQVANEIINKRSKLNNESQLILGRNSLKSESEFQSKISTLFSSSSIDMNTIKIKNFEYDELNDSISIIKSDLQFEKLTSEQFYAAINTLIVKEKMKLESISMSKSQSDNLLRGTMSLNYSSKIASRDE